MLFQGAQHAISLLMRDVVGEPGDGEPGGSVSAATGGAGHAGGGAARRRPGFSLHWRVVNHQESGVLDQQGLPSI